MPMFDFTLVISPPDVGFEEAADRLYGGGCWDGTFAVSQGVHEIVFSRKASSFREVVISTIRDLAVAGIGSRVVRILIDDPPEEIDDADRIADAMLAEGLPGRFVDGLRDAAIWSRVLDLMVLWEQSIAAAAMADADEAVADLQDLLDDTDDRPDGIVYKPMPDCRIVAGKIAALKADLEAKVEVCGGTAWLAGETGIPKPSLDRLFSSGLMPRRATLRRIGEALGLPEEEIVAMECSDAVR